MTNKQLGMLDALEKIERYLNIRQSEISLNPQQGLDDEAELLAYLFTRTSYLRMQVRSLGGDDVDELEERAHG